MPSPNVAGDEVATRPRLPRDRTARAAGASCELTIVTESSSKIPLGESKIFRRHYGGRPSGAGPGRSRPASRAKSASRRTRAAEGFRWPHGRGDRTFRAYNTAAATSWPTRIRCRQSGPGIADARRSTRPMNRLGRAFYGDFSRAARKEIVSHSRPWVIVAGRNCARVIPDCGPGQPGWLARPAGAPTAVRPVLVAAPSAARVGASRLSSYPARPPVARHHERATALARAMSGKY